MIGGGNPCHPALVAGSGTTCCADIFGSRPRNKCGVTEYPILSLDFSANSPENAASLNS